MFALNTNVVGKCNFIDFGFGMVSHRLVCAFEKLPISGIFRHNSFLQNELENEIHSVGESATAGSTLLIGDVR